MMISLRHRQAALGLAFLISVATLSLWRTILTPVEAACVNVTTVTNGNDTGAGSLREAVANTCDSGSVTFDAALSGVTITLASPIPITQTVTIENSEPMTLTSGTQQRLFEVQAAGTLTLTGMRLNGGGSSSIDGGLIENLGSLVVINTMMKRGASRSGGAIANEGTLVIERSTIQQNIATDAGGGVYNAGTGSMTIRNSQVYTNGSGSIGGGAIYNTGQLTVSTSSLDFNLADQAGFAAGVYNTLTGTIYIENSSLSNNNNNGLLNLGQGRLFMTEISSNNALTGAGIYNGSTGRLVVDQTTVEQNRVAYQGGGIYNIGQITGTKSSVLNNETSDGVGAGIYHAGSEMLLENMTVSSNTATQFGGGIYLNGPAEIRFSTIISNFTNQSGSGLYVFTGTVATVANSLFSGNTSGDCFGTLSTNSYNLINSTGTAACNLTNGINNNLIGVAPLLKTRQFNGGPTPNYEVSPGSPAIDAADSGSCVAADQRNAVRPVGSNCDIGSVEAGLPKLSVVKSGADFAVPNQTITFTIIASNLSNVPVSSVVITDVLVGEATFVDGSISLSPDQPGATVAATGADLPNLVSGLVISPNESVSIQYAVTSNSTFSDVFTNTAYIASDDEWTSNPQENLSAKVVRLSQNNFSIGSAVAVEPNGNQSITVVVSRTNSAIASSVQVGNQNVSADAGLDYNFSPTIVNFTANGPLTESVSIEIIDDNLVEAAETFRVELLNPTNGAIVGQSNLVTITDLDTATITVTNRTVSETVGTFDVGFQLDRAIDGLVTATITAQNGDAIASSDFVPINQTVEFGPGFAETETVSVEILDDNSAEGNEAFTLLISELELPTGISSDRVQVFSSTITILDNDVEYLIYQPYVLND